MKYLFILLFFFLFPFGIQAQSNDDVNSQYKVHCDCEHIAGVLENTTKEEANDPCIDLTRELSQTDLGAVGIQCEGNDCTCIFSHSVFGFGEDRDSAIENASTTCDAVSQSTGKEFAITSPETCKDEQ